MVLRSALAFTSSVVVHALVFGVMWLQPAPPPPPPPPDGSPVSLAAFDFDDAPTESSSPTPSEVATPPDEAPPAPVAVTAPVTPLPDPMGIDSQPPQPEAAMETGEGEKAAEEKKKGPTLTHGAKARRPTRTPKPCPESVCKSSSKAYNLSSYSTSCSKSSNSVVVSAVHAILHCHAKRRQRATCGSYVKL
jgi:hypothetical protein